MHKNTNQLLKLVNQLMNFRKIEDNKYVLNYSHINIVEVLREIYTRFTPLAHHKHIEFNFVSDCDYYEISLDQELFISAVSNLLTNAFKFTKSSIGLSLSTSLSATPGDSGRNHIKIAVRDNGIGIPEEKIKMIFDPFFQIEDQKTENPSFSGIGLGLSYTKSIVELHSGLLVVNSKSGEGSDFIIELPDNNAEPRFNTQEQTVDNSIDIYESASGITNTRTIENSTFTQGVFLTTDHPEILVVEDNEDLRQFLSRHLQRQYLIHLAENGLKALGILRKHEIQLIITDVMMPEMDGIELCKHIKSNVETSHIPVIILTAKTNIESKIEGTEIGAEAFIEKPFSFEYLSVLIKSLIDNRALLKAKFTQQPFSKPNEITNSKADEKFLTTIDELIQDNLNNPDFSIDELSKALMISRSGFHRKLVSISTLTPNDYIKLIRLKKAAELLRERQLRINEICDIVGFKSPSYFTKCFQEQFDMLPSDFAKM
jgi:DNA-binding response OmpR family regulator